MKTAENSRGSYAFPIVIRDEKAILSSDGFYSNIHSQLLALNLRSKSPMEVLSYVYSILYSPSYRTRYAGALKIEFPKIPSSCSNNLFISLARLGNELVFLHLLESPKVNQFITHFTGAGDNSIPKKPIYKDGSVWINACQRFENVPETVWNFHIGGYQVCEKWLKDRKGRRLSEDDIAHYQKIVVALNETIRLMQEIDAVIDRHGGWPAAFQTQEDDKDHDG